MKCNFPLLLAMLITSRGVIATQPQSSIAGVSKLPAFAVFMYVAFGDESVRSQADQVVQAAEKKQEHEEKEQEKEANNDEEREAEVDSEEEQEEEKGEEEEEEEEDEQEQEQEEEEEEDRLDSAAPLLEELTLLNELGALEADMRNKQASTAEVKEQSALLLQQFRSLKRNTEDAKSSTVLLTPPPSSDDVII
mmetsp:Transcript_66249/g.130526  ORF Transcript_66249/g.130526 Transcript_66249/m.130526 type:complete len:193 (-) Transcript_66249:271-849(-)